jgi:adenosine deaminase
MAGAPAALIVASSWARTGGHATRLARLAVRYAEHGVVGFGLSNDERLGLPDDFVPAFQVATEAGLLSVPHAGFYEAAWHVRTCVDKLGARRIGHGLTAMSDPATVQLLASHEVALEVCPTSYPPLDVSELVSLPIRELLTAGVPVALGSDDPLLFGSDVTDQYVIAHQILGLTRSELAALARHSVTASAAPKEVKRRLNDGIAAWSTPPPTNLPDGVPRRNAH